MGSITASGRSRQPLCTSARRVRRVAVGLRVHRGVHANAVAARVGEDGEPVLWGISVDELRDYFRHCTTMNEVLPLGVQREQFRTRLAELRAMIRAA